MPSQLLLAYGLQAAGTTAIGYPDAGEIEQHWGKFTGRFGLDWKPDVSFTDDTLIYAFYSRGYKAGGVNPPSPGYATVDDLREQIAGETDPVAIINGNQGIDAGRNERPGALRSRPATARVRVSHSQRLREWEICQQY